ncbi:hypothetical protein O3M35_004754 [Rhynocoris fuscipes]|uniref:Bcl-2 Bcl-2 homology region 1-3 domain-containing protein n=1 Tax=Rhynocoris fuscipes TaxID=488301 RepID=A0AAW1DL29_9HEMI
MKVRNLEITSDCEYLVKQLLDERLCLLPKCNLPIIERNQLMYKHLTYGIDLYTKYGANILQKIVKKLWLSDDCNYELFSSVVDELLLNEISWIQICGLFALIDRLSIFCKKSGRIYIAKIAAENLIVYIEKNLRIMEFLEKNGGWVNILDNQVVYEDIEEFKKIILKDGLKIIVLSLLCLWRYW